MKKTKSILAYINEQISFFEKLDKEIKEHNKEHLIHEMEQQEMTQEQFGAWVAFIRLKEFILK